jgi:hypothetical protein
LVAIFNSANAVSAHGHAARGNHPRASGDEIIMQPYWSQGTSVGAVIERHKFWFLGYHFWLSVV